MGIRDNNLFGFNCLYFEFLSGEVAESSRRNLDLRRGEFRRSGGGRGGTRHANDALVLDLVNRRGHPLLKRVFFRMKQNSNDGRSEEEILAVLSDFLAYMKVQYKRPCTTRSACNSRLKNPRFRPAIDAFIQVFSQDYVGRLYLCELKSIAIGHETRRRGKLYGMFGGRFQLCTRKFSEQAFEPCRNPLPTDLQLIDESGCPLTIQDNRGEDHGGLSISVLTRLHANREDLLAHRFPKIVLRNLKQSIEESLHADDSDNDELITALAFEELNVHVGFSDDGKYKREYERTNGDTTLYFIPRVAAAFKAAYVEYFDDAVQEES